MNFAQLVAGFNGLGLLFNKSEEIALAEDCGSKKDGEVTLHQVVSAFAQRQDVREKQTARRVLAEDEKAAAVLQAQEAAHNEKRRVEEEKWEAIPVVPVTSCLKKGAGHGLKEAKAVLKPG